MDIFNFMAGGAVLGVVAACWDKIKALVWRVANLFVRQVEVPSEAAHEAVVAYLIAHYTRSRWYDSMYGAVYEYQRDGRYGLVPYELFGNRSILFWNGAFPFLFRNEREQKATGGANQAQGGNNDATKIYCTLTFLRGTVDVEEILRGACDKRNKLAWAVASAEEEAKNRFCIHHVPPRGEEGGEGGYGSDGLAWYQQPSYRLLSHKPEQLGKGTLHRGKALESLIFPGRVKALISEIALWRNHRPWYLDKGIPWKRGWLLYGPPGTGKTALARAFAEDLNMPIYVFNLAELSNNALLKAWGEMQVNVPCLALIEDIDNVFHGRQNVAHKHGLMPMMFARGKGDQENDDRRDPFTPLTFDTLLNCLDGVERSDGVFTIITTNDIAKVDPALGQPRKLPDGSVEFISTRPGRVDKAVELTYMEPGDKKLMARRILGEYPEEYARMLEFIDKFPELQETPAQFQERCGQIALARFWKQQQEAVGSTAVGGWSVVAEEEEAEELVEAGS